jgi:hypothetical protein
MRNTWLLEPADRPRGGVEVAREGASPMRLARDSRRVAA